MRGYGRMPGLPLVWAGVLMVAGCRGAAVAASGSGAEVELSGAPQPDADYGTRKPRTCAKLTTAPTAAQAAALVQCSAEGYQRGSDLILVTEVSVQMGAPRNPGQNDTLWNGIDLGAKVYPIAGHMRRYDCGLVRDYGVGTNCETWAPLEGNTGSGACYRTTDGGWVCALSGWSATFTAGQRGPTTY